MAKGCVQEIRTSLAAELEKQRVHWTPSTRCAPNGYCSTAVSQLIFEGKTDARRPNRDGVSDQVLFSHAESHWQTVSSLENFMLFLDSKLIPAESEERRDWIFVLDFAESMAETIMTEQKIKTSLQHLRKRTVTWADQATLAIQGRPDLRKSAWKL